MVASTARTTQRENPNMSTKTKSTKKTTAETTAALKFAKGAFYQDRQDRLWCCANARTKTAKDGTVVVQMQLTEYGEPVGELAEEPADVFVKQLSAVELKEYRAICQREREAEEAATTTPAPARKTKAAKATAQPAAEPKTSKTKKAKPASDTPKKMSALDAAAKVLAESGEPMGSKEMIETMSTKGYWTSPGGQTPHATLYAAILREINVKGSESRFQKTDRGLFALQGAVVEPAPVATKATGKKAKKDTAQTEGGAA